MCTDGHSDPQGLTRRRFVQSASLAAAAALLPRGAWSRPALAATAGGPIPISMAMHIHSSFSEQAGSMEGHLAEAQRNAVDVIWWTDHDYRMSAFKHRKVVHFTSLTNEVGDGKPWQWQQERIGSLTTGSTGGIVASPASPLDTVAGSSLRVRAQTTTSGVEAALRYYAESHAADWNYHDNLTDQSLYLEVFPEAAGRYGYLELMVASSYHPAHGSRSAGNYTISYRLGGAGMPGSRVAKGLLGIVTLPVTPGQWNSLVVHPDRDIAALWPDMDPRDFGLYGLRLGAVSSGAATSGYFDYLRFSRATSGDVPLQLQQDIGSRLVNSYPGVAQRQGLEVSYIGQHVNWFGGAVALPDYSRAIGRGDTAFLKGIIADIHARGGLSSYNHPFGASAPPMLPQSTQDQLQAEVAASILANNALDNDMIEVGYPSRAGVDLTHHIGAWDVCSRNALFLTGTGTSDDHDGVDWRARTNDWTTSVWASDTSEAALLAALRAGRGWSGSLNSFRGSLDLLADGSCPMGSASVSGLSQRQLTVMAAALPVDGSLRVVQGVVDYAGGVAPAPSNRTVATYPSAALASGSVILPVDTSTSSYVRTEALDPSGRVIGASNPLWLLRELPSRGIPSARAC